MNEQNTHCGDGRLRDMLCFEQADGGSQGTSFPESEVHIEQCPECQARLAVLAALPSDWNLVRESLSPNDADETEYSRGRWMTRRSPGVPSAWTDSMARQLLSPPSHPKTTLEEVTGNFLSNDRPLRMLDLISKRLTVYWKRNSLCLNWITRPL
ncbi:MAG: hypothetical protein KDA96_21855 [Planctomycetaceae bacterium]|nr:hypothetical protein [Planctomycetaceae bacterium]